MLLLFLFLFATSVLIHATLNENPDGNASWSYQFIPMYIFFGIVGVCAALTVFLANRDKDNPANKFKIVVANVLQFAIIALAFLTTLFLNLHLSFPEYQINYDLYLAFGLATLVVFLGTMILLSVWRPRTPNEEDLRDLADRAALTQVQCASLCYHDSEQCVETARRWIGFFGVMSVAVTFVIALIDSFVHNDEVSALEINIPIIVGLSILIVWALLFVITICRTIKKKDDSNNAKPNSFDTTAKLFSFAIAVCFLSFALVAVVLASIKLDNLDDPDAISWNLVFSFVYATFGLPLVFLAGGLVAIQFKSSTFDVHKGQYATTVMLDNVSNRPPSFLPFTTQTKCPIDEREEI